MGAGAGSHQGSTLLPLPAAPPLSLWGHTASCCHNDATMVQSANVCVVGVCPLRGQSQIATHPALISRKGNNSPSLCQSPVPLSHLSHTQKANQRVGDLRAQLPLWSHLVYLFSPVIKSAGSGLRVRETGSHSAPSSCDLGSYMTALCFSFPVCKTGTFLGVVVRIRWRTKCTAPGIVLGSC